MADGFPLQSLAEQTVTSAGTRVQINSGTTLLCFSAIITADVGNAGQMYVGNDTVASTRFAKSLDAGESMTVGMMSNRPQFELSSVWLDSDNDGEGCHVHYI